MFENMILFGLILVCLYLYYAFYISDVEAAGTDLNKEIEANKKRYIASQLLGEV